MRPKPGLIIVSGVSNVERKAGEPFAGSINHLSKSQNIRRVWHCPVAPAGLLLSVLV